MIQVNHLKKHLDDRGWLMEVLRCDDPIFFNKEHPFGQMYCTTIRPGIVKAWHLHEHQTDRICCIKGRVRLVVINVIVNSTGDGKVLFDEVIGDENPVMVMFPPGLWHGFSNVGDSEAYVVNIPDVPHDHSNPDELRRPWDSLAFNWGVGNR